MQQLYIKHASETVDGLKDLYGAMFQNHLGELVKIHIPGLQLPDLLTQKPRQMHYNKYPEVIWRHIKN